MGIVGRTGAGKSTILSVLFRLVERSEGVVEIDGVDTQSIGLKLLRSSLAMIPQEVWSIFMPSLGHSSSSCLRLC